MKIHTLCLRHPMAVILAAVFFVACEGVTPEETVPDDPDAPKYTDLYITDPEGLWRDGMGVCINGTGCGTTMVDDSTAKAVVKVAGEPIYVAVPSTAVFDSTSRSYTLTLPSSQRYDAPRETFIAAACSYGSGGFPFRTVTLSGIAGYVTIDLFTTGSARPSWASLAPADSERACAGTLSRDCVSGSWSIIKGEHEVRLSLPPGDMSTTAGKPDRLTFAVLPGTYEGGFVITLEGGRQISVSRKVIIGSRQSESLGTFHIDPDTEVMDLSISKTVPLGAPSWAAGTRLSINGCTAEATGVTDPFLTVPFSRSSSYSIVYPVADRFNADGSYSMHIATEQILAEKAPSSDPILCGSGTSGSSLELKQVSGVLRLKIYTAPGPKRLLKSVRLLGEGVAATFNIDPSSGAITRTGESPEGITVDFGTAHKQESSDPSAPTAFSFVVLPGSYKGLTLEVTARDATCKIPEGLSENDLWTITSYDVPDAQVTAGTSTILTLEPQVKEYDWIRQNGVCYTGSKGIAQCTAAFIDTGWLVPAGSGHSVSYECTMSGSLPQNVSDLRQERVLFGSQASGSDKPVFLVFNENASARAWYATMANLAGRETYKQETSGQCYHMAADLDGLRTLVIGTDGIKNSSFIYMRLRRDDLGSTTWTDLHPKTDYFKFKSGSLSNAYPLYLFCKNYNGNIGSPCPHIRIHRFIVRYDGVVQRDLTPCTVDGIPGMVDNAHPGTYYFNPNPNVETVVKNGCLTALEVGKNSDLQ